MDDEKCHEDGAEFEVDSRNSCFSIWKCWMAIYSKIWWHIPPVPEGSCARELAAKDGRVVWLFCREDMVASHGFCVESGFEEI